MVQHCTACVLWLDSSSMGLPPLLQRLPVGVGGGNPGAPSESAPRAGIPLAPSPSYTTDWSPVGMVLYPKLFPLDIENHRGKTA